NARGDALDGRRVYRARHTGHGCFRRWPGQRSLRAYYDFIQPVLLRDFARSLECRRRMAVAEAPQTFSDEQLKVRRMPWRQRLGGEQLTIILERHLVALTLGEIEQIDRRGDARNSSSGTRAAQTERVARDISQSEIAEGTRHVDEHSVALRWISIQMKRVV